jgi:hypothetical protein
MAVSFSYRDAVRHRKRKLRRFKVVFFFVLMAIGLSEAGRPWTWTNFGPAAVPYLLVFTWLMSWKRIGDVPIKSLDDLAMEEYGVEYEQTTPAQQTDLLRLARHRRQRVPARPYYRVGAYLLRYHPDEYDNARERESLQRTHSILRVLLPSVVVVYWLGWKLLPEGYARAAWTNGPVVLFWLSLLVIALPQIIRLWTEPDDPGEPKLVPSAAEKEA